MPYYDAYTASTFAAAYGRPMQVFTNSSVSPALYSDEAQFLPGLIGTFTTAIMNFVRQTFPNTKFEVLYPPDVNDTPLNGAVNLPATWNASTLDCLKTENFTYTGGIWIWQRTRSCCRCNWDFHGVRAVIWWGSRDTPRRGRRKCGWRRRKPSSRSCCSHWTSSA